MVWYDCFFIAGRVETSCKHFDDVLRVFLTTSYYYSYIRVILSAHSDDQIHINHSYNGQLFLVHA